MNRNQVLVRTAKGQDEVLNKAYQLAPDLRHLLILIDEDHTIGETFTQLAGLWKDLEARIETLVAEGFLAVRPSLSELGGLNIDQWELRAAGLLDPRELPPPAAPAFNLEKAKDFARVTVLESLCPIDAEHVERIDAAQSVGELRVELDELREILPRFLPQRQAKQMWAQLEPLMLPLGADQDRHAPPATLLGHWYQ